MIDSLRLDRAAVRVDVRDHLTRMHAVWVRMRCRLMGGHWRVLHTTRHHVSLRCVACGSETPGWQVGRVNGA